MTEHTKFYCEIQEASVAAFDAWLLKNGRTATAREHTNEHMVRLFVHLASPAYQTNVKRSLCKALNVLSTGLVLRVPKRTDVIHPTPPVDNIDAMGIDELRAQLRIAQEAAHNAMVPAAAVNAQAPDLSVADLAKIILELQAKVERLTPGTTNNTINTTNNIVINNFGNETMTHLKSPEEYRRLLGYAGMKRVLDDTYFNPAVPENHNVKSRSVKKNMVEVRRGDVWEVRPFAEVANTMIDRGFGYTYGGFVVTPENAEAPETYALLDLMRKTHHARLREGIRAALVTRKDRARAL